jgi:hypothetical protein
MLAYNCPQLCTFWAPTPPCTYTMEYGRGTCTCIIYGSIANSHNNHKSLIWVVVGSKIKWFRTIELADSIQRKINPCDKWERTGRVTVRVFTPSDNAVSSNILCRHQQKTTLNVSCTEFDNLEHVRFTYRHQFREFWNYSPTAWCILGFRRIIKLHIVVFLVDIYSLVHLITLSRCRNLQNVESWMWIMTWEFCGKKQR